MMVNVSVNSLIALVVTSMLVSAVGTLVLALVVKRVRTLGRKRLVLLDDDGNECDVKLVKTGGKIGKKSVGSNQVIVGKGDDGRVYTLQGEARYGGEYPTWVLHKRHGVNLGAVNGDTEESAPDDATVAYRGPTDAGFFHASTFMAALSVFDPALNYKAIAINDAQDTVNKNDDADKYGWVPVVVIGAGLTLLAILGLLVYMVTKIRAGAA